MSLKKQTAYNSMLMGSMLLIMRPINFIASIILARLLDPSDFGLIALALVLVQSSNLFTNLGLEQAMIHSNQDQEKVAFQSFVVGLISSALFYVAVLIYAPQLALLLGDARITPLLRWLSLLILLGGLSLAPSALLRKQMMFSHIALVNLFSLLSYTITVIAFAYTGFGVWSLVYANLLSTLIATILLWLWAPGWDWLIPKPWDGKVMRDLLSYGMQVCGSGLLSYFHTHWDDWFVGRMLGAASLGFYSKAYDFSNKTIGQVIKSTVGTVFFPSYAKMQNDHAWLSRAYLKAVSLVFMFVTPLALGVIVMADPLVYVVLSEKWMPMVTAFQIFSLMILTRPISENSAPFFQAVGRPSHNTRAGVVLLVVMVPGVLYLSRWGIEGVAFAVAISHLFGVFYNIYQVNAILPGTAKSTFKMAMPILFSGLIMMVGIQIGKHFVTEVFGGLYNISAILALVSIGATLYFLMLFITQRQIMIELWQIFLESLPRRLWSNRLVEK